MNKKINPVFAIVIVILITVVTGVAIWLGQRESYQATQTIPRANNNIVPKKNAVTDNQVPEKKPDITNETENTSQAMKKRFSGTGCYSKESDGTDNLYELSKDFNLSSPNVKVAYSNQTKGISLEIPYNPSWGNKNCKVEPYVEFTQPSGNVLLEFGKPRAWIRSEFLLTISNYRTAEDIIGEQKNVGGEPNPNPRKMTLGNNQVVVFESYGMTVERIYEVIGKKYNYSFGYVEGEKLNEKTAKELEIIIGSMKIE